MEQFIPLALPPGVANNGTKYQNKGRWVAANLVRWHEGALRPVGGWVPANDATGIPIQVLGFPRGATAWRDNNAHAWLGIGTTGTGTTTLSAFSEGTLTDITPAGITDGLADGSLVLGGAALPYSSGLYGDGLYGSPSTGASIADADTWSMDNFGETPLFCLTSDGVIYSWDLNTADKAVAVSGAPTSCHGLVVTPERFLFALGAGGDPRLVQWPDQQSLTDWTPTAANQAGDFPLQTTGKLIAGHRSARETLLWTTTDLWGAVYVGGELVYSFAQRGQNCGLWGPNAAVIADGAAYWMSSGQFFVYDGAVRPIPCDVKDAVFGDISETQKAKIQAIAIPEFSEVWWFYPSVSQSGTENDRYVSYNYRSGFWMLGTVNRAAGVGDGVFSNPILFDDSGFMYSHEDGFDHGGQAPFVESGPLEIGTGDRLLRVQRLISDELILGTVHGTLLTALYPTDAETVTGPFQLNAPTSVRVTGRQFRLRLEEVIQGGTITVPPGISHWDGTFRFDGTLLYNGTAPGTVQQGSGRGSDWRIGTFRVGVLEGGYR